MRWRHIIINTHSTWLHGDRRGFRSRDHRIHSSGDYKNPPPVGEHADLNSYRKKQSADPTKLAPAAYATVGSAILANIHKQNFRFVALSVNATHVHVHVLVELPDDVERVKEIVGWFKWFATRDLREAHPEYTSIEIWADGETYKAVDDPQYFCSTEKYILEKQGADAWTYSARTTPIDHTKKPGPQDPA